MNRIIAAVGMATMFAGCAFNPEAMPVGDKDSAVYVDAGAPKNLFAAEAKAKVAVITSVGEYTTYKAVGETLDSMVTDESELITVYYGQDIEEEAANKLIGELEEKYPDCDVSVYNGGQPLYYYIISVE